MNTKRNIYKDILFGVAVGDALGVPFEFKSRKSMMVNPATDMIGHGSHNQPPGTWSDDSSLTFCLAEALITGFNLKAIASNFIKWETEGYWTAHGDVFDIGIGTSKAIHNLKKKVQPDLCGGFEEDENGNGSLMRILPLAGYLMDKPIDERFELTKKVSSITHAHIRSVIACFYYLEYARLIISGINKREAYERMQGEVCSYLNSISINPKEIEKFDRLLRSDISNCQEQEVGSSGYVLHALEACIWCILNTNNYHDAVLRAVNLGEDTDSTAAITGGLAGLIYGYESIPENWIRVLARKNDIDKLSDLLNHK